jgi:hypothetical protein
LETDSGPAPPGFSQNFKGCAKRQLQGPNGLSTLKIILDPEEFFWSERPYRPLHFLLFVLRSQVEKIGWSKELK